MKKPMITHQDPGMRPASIAGKISAVLPGLMLCFSSLFMLHAQAQVSLPAAPSSSYTQDFGTTASTTLPTGWSLRGNLTATTEGTVATVISNSSTTYSTITGGGCYNITSLTAGRALSIRQSGSFGDFSGSSNQGCGSQVDIANTLGRTSFSLSVNLLQFDNAGRTTIWSIQYSTNGGTAWTTVGTFTPAANGSTPATYTFGSALDNLSGVVKIRMAALAISTGSGSRDMTGWDDFVLSWVNPVTCTTPSSLAAANITTTSANLNWGTVSGASGYQYVIDQTSANPSGAGTAVSTNSYAASSLTPSTVYYLHVRTDCGSSTYSGWATKSFTTSTPCGSIAGLTANNINTTSADLSWNTVSGVTNYQYVLDQNAADPSGAGTTVTTNSYAATGLTPTTVYYMHVRSNCGSSNLSAWNTYSFTTLTPCGNITGLTAGNITVNSADLSWDVVSGINNYEYVLDQTSADPSAAGTATATPAYAATGLAPGTVYYMHVRTDCGSNNLSAWNTYSFTTVSPCGTITGLTANNIFTTSADLNWDVVPSIINYEYVLDQTAAAPSAAGTSVTTNSYAATGLTPATVYYMHVRTDCGSGLLSGWNTYSFTTVAVCGSITGLTANNIGLTSADLNWNTVSGINNYEYVLDQTATAPSLAGTAITTNSYAATGLASSTVYYMHVRTDCGSNNLSAWNTYSFTTLTPCGSISGLAANNIGLTSADLNWNTVAGITSYEYVLDQTATAPSVAGTAITTNSYAATGLASSTVYYMHVRTNCGSNNLSAWNTYSFSTLTPCGSISGLAANNIGLTSADLNWNTVAGITNYQYVLDQTATAPSAAGTAITTNSYAATGLTSSTVYYMHVRTNCGSNNLSAWNTYSFTTLTPCGSISGLAANNIGLTSADLNWNSVSGIVNYEYVLDQTATAPSIAGTSITTNSYAATGLASSTVYFMHVRTNCGSNNLSAWNTYSFSTLTPCGSISGLAANNIGLTSADLNWNSVSGIVNYEYVLDQTATAPATAGTAITTNSYAATSLASSTVYYMHVRTNCGSNNLSAWNTYSFTTLTPCGSITGLTANNIGTTTADLNWNSVSGIVNYEYVLDQTATAPSAAGTATTTNSYAATGLTPTTVYYIHVRTNCGSNNLSAWATYSFTTQTPCGTISGLTAGNITTTSADLNWNSVSGINNYDYVLDQTATAPATAGTAVTTNSYAATGLTPATVYYMHVRTSCGTNNLSAWTTYSFTTLTPCGNITGLTAGNITTTSADLNWNTVSSINNYEYVLDQTAGDPAAAGTAITTNSYAATGLATGTVYYMHVRTDCGNGNTSVWATYSFTTTSACGNVSGLAATNITTTSADLSWTAVSGIANYEYVVDQTATAPTAAGTATTSNTYTATGLTAGTVYYLHVRTDCGSGNTSVWATYSFTTTAVCGGITGLAATAVTTTSASLNWNAVPGILNYEYLLNQSATPPGVVGAAMSTNSYAATGLTPATVYYMHVRTDCGGNNTSAWSTVSFTTSTVATGIEDANNLSSRILVFPNPVTDVLNIRTDAQLSNSRITLSDISGKILLSLQATSTLTTLDTKDLAAGVYFLNIQTTAGQMNSRIIKQ